jgi:hypothetical protein
LSPGTKYKGYEKGLPLSYLSNIGRSEKENGFYCRASPSGKNYAGQGTSGNS